MQAKPPEELERLMEAVTDSMETAASTADLSTARQGLLHSMERLIRESLAAPAPVDGCLDTGKKKYTQNTVDRWREDGQHSLNRAL